MFIGKNFVGRISKRAHLTPLLILAVLLSAVSLPARNVESAPDGLENQGVDLTFNAVPGLIPADGKRGEMIVQPDGKIIAFGYFEFLNGLIKKGIARTNTDGSIDQSFNCAVCDFHIEKVVLQPDGKILVAGASEEEVEPKFYRLNPDGSVDNTFASPFTQPRGSVKVWGLTTVGKIYVTAIIGPPGTVLDTIYRLNSDGTLDNTFTPLATDGSLAQFYREVRVLPDGRAMVAGVHPFGYLFRLNLDGSKDFSFQSPILTHVNPQLPKQIYNFLVQPDGKIAFTGIFTSVNGIACNRVARLNTDGSVDQQFVLSAPVVIGFLDNAHRLELLPDGKYILSWRYMSGQKFVRLNSNGSQDATYNSPDDLWDLISWTLDNQQRVVFFGHYNPVSGPLKDMIQRLNTDGSKDSSFVIRNAAAPPITALAAQPDGKVIVAGNFCYMNNFEKDFIARVNADGSTDPSFNFNSFNSILGTPNQFAVQSDGKILTLVRFSEPNGTPAARIIRLNTDGSVDPTLALSISQAETMALQADGKILIGGGSMGINGFARTGVARINPDGSVDPTFSPSFATPFVVKTVLQQPDDGKIIVGGFFSNINGVNRTNIARLNANGSLDTTFNAGSIATVNHLLYQPNGTYLAVTNTVIRLFNNGTTDNTFVAPLLAGGAVNAIVLQGDGKIVVGGTFTLPRARIARLQSDGSLDSGFLADGANAKVNALVKQADGRIIVGGEFTEIGKVPRLGVARLYGSSPNAKPFDFDGDGKADISVFRPSTGTWYLSQSTSGFRATAFGTSGDLIAPADYDGDGKADVAVFRPSNGYWYILNSSDNSFRATQFGQSGDIPAAGDYDGDGKADISLYRPSNNNFYVLHSSNNSLHFQQWGASGDLPVMGDYDGDRKTDYAIFRPSIGTFYILRSTDGVVIGQQFGQSGDKPIAGDFDADGKTDIGVYRPSNGGWYYLQSSDNGFRGIAWGTSGDIPSAGDYDGDGKTDVAVFRPSTGIFYILQSTNNSLRAEQFGANGDVPVPSAFVP